MKCLARELLETLKAERLVLEWRSWQRTRAAVFVAIQEVLENLPQKYPDDDYGFTTVLPATVYTFYDMALHALQGTAATLIV